MNNFSPLIYPEQVTSFQSSDLNLFLEWCVNNEVSDITFQNEEHILSVQSVKPRPREWG